MLNKFIAISIIMAKLCAYCGQKITGRTAKYDVHAEVYLHDGLINNEMNSLLNAVDLLELGKKLRVPLHETDEQRTAAARRGVPCAQLYKHQKEADGKTVSLQTVDLRNLTE